MAEPAEAVPPMVPDDPDDPPQAEQRDDQFLSMVDQVARNVPEDEPYAKKAWFCLHRDVFPRKECIAIVENVWFDRIVLGLIALNCLTMTLFASPIVKSVLEEKDIPAELLDQKSLWAARHWTYNLLKPMGDCQLDAVVPCSFAQWVDFCFLIVFAIEMVIKMLASGLCMHKHSYLRSGWNWLDFIVVMVGFIDQFSANLPGINTIRLVKTFRPLRSMQRIRGLRVLVQCILEALPQMCNVAVFLIFTLILFGLFGHAFFKGKLRHSCHNLVDGEWVSTGEICDAECTWDEMTMQLDGVCGSLGNLTRNEQNKAHYWRWSYSCRNGQECRCSETGTADPWCDYRDNPNYGITSFDSLPWAMVSLFQAISLEGWVDMMYQLMDGCSVFVVIYFILLILFGAIIVMNLFLAVLCDNFEMADRDGEPEEKEEDIEVVTARAMESLEHENKCRQMCLDLVKMKQFGYFIDGCILFNTLLMCIKSFPEPSNPLVMSIHTLPQWDYLDKGFWMFLTIMNIILTLIFTCEMVIKIVGLGPKLYKKDAMNLFDAFVVLFSIIEIALELNKKANPGSTELPIPLSVLRAFRIFRLFKLVRSVETLRKILATLVSSMRSVVYLALLLCLVILIFILLGMELFGGRYPHPEYNYTSVVFPNTFADAYIDWDEGEDLPLYSRYNFDSFGAALLSIFVVLSGENWNEIMFDSHRASWPKDVVADANLLPYLPWAITYFILLFVVGNLLLFNLFIAILLSNFDDDEEEEEEPGPLGEESMGKASSRMSKGEDKGTMEWSFGEYRAMGIGRKSSVSMANGAEGSIPEEEEPAGPDPFFPDTVDEGGGDKSLKIFGWDNPVRIYCAKLIENPNFENIIVVLILLSTLCLIIDMPSLPESSPLRSTLYIFNFVFTVLFTLEMIVKIIAFSFIFSKTPTKYQFSEAYLRNGWNILDFVIVIISVLSLIPGQNSLKQLRAFRAIRPMRLVSRYESLKITFQTLLKSIPAMGSLLTVASLFFCIFGILGLELFGGKFGYCMDPVYSGEIFGARITPGLGPNGQTDYEECMALPRYNLTRRTTDGILISDIADVNGIQWLEYVEYPQWLQPQFGHFDDMAYSLVLLFEISALEGWPDVMHWAMDTDGKVLYIQPWLIDTNPIDWMGSGDWAPSSEGRPPIVGMPTHEHVTSNIEAGIFFILWIVFGCFVIVNMTIGVVVDTFAQIKAENDGLLLMSEEAADWVKAQKQVLSQRPLKAAVQPEAPWRLNFYYLVTSTRFEVFIMAIIMLNMLQMACDWFEPNPDAQDYMPPLKEAMGVINIVFFVIYVIEMLLKWIGLGIDQYFKNAWNVFDFVLVIISLVDLILYLGDGDNPFPTAVVRCLRLFRVARILRIVKTAKQLRTIMLTVYISLPQLNNILILIALIIIIVDMLLVGFFFSVNYTPGLFQYDSYKTVWNHSLAYIPEERYFVSDWHYLAAMEDAEETNWGLAVNRHANFAFFWTGALTLVRSSTGESFNLIMHDLYGPEWGHNRMTCCDQCGPILDPNYEEFYIGSTGETVQRAVPMGSCGNTAVAFIIYFLFQMVMAYIVLSIMIGIILENFANVGSETKKIRMEDLEDFREVWLKYDPKGTFVVPSHNLLAILQQLKEPLGIQGANPPLTRADMLKHLGKLDIPDHSGYIHFVETLTAVSNAVAGVPVPVCETTNKMAKATLTVPGLKKLERPAHSALTNYLVSLLQSRWRGYAMRKMYTDEDLAAGADASGNGYSGKVKGNQVAPSPP